MRSDDNLATIRETRPDELDAVLDIERRAFGHETEADLVRDMLADASADPKLSLLAFDGGRPVGHILFTAVTMVGTAAPVPASILAPLAVVPEARGRGFGGKLIEEGFRRLALSGVRLVFVLGHPDYYRRFAFIPAGRSGFAAPYPIPAEHGDAWMVKALADGVIGSIVGQVRCADTLSRPELWRE